MSTQDQITFDAFVANVEALGMVIDATAMAKMAAASGTVDLATIPTKVQVGFAEYTPKNAKAPVLYVKVIENIPDQEKPVKHLFGRVSAVKAKLDGLDEEIRSAELLAEILPQVCLDIENGNAQLPEGWVITGDSDNGKGYAATKA